MEVVITTEAGETHSGCYHLLNDANTGSLCGVINEDSRFASRSSQVLSRETAERRGLTICGNCATVADRRQAVSGEVTD